MRDREPMSDCSVITQDSVQSNKDLISHSLLFSYLKFIIFAVPGRLCMSKSEACNLLEPIRRSSEDI